MDQKLSIKTAFKAILKLESAMLSNSGNDNYYVLQRELNQLLNDFIRCDFSTLSSKHLLKLCSLVNSHRPCSPLSFLIYCSALNDRIS